MTTSLQRRLRRAKSSSRQTAVYPRAALQLEDYLLKAEEFKKETRIIAKESTKRKLANVEEDPIVFTERYWKRLKWSPQFTSNAKQIFWTDFEAFLAEFGMAPSRKHKLTRLPYLKHWTKHTTYWELK